MKRIRRLWFLLVTARWTLSHLARIEPVNVLRHE
jgi:hypothetical protein